MLEVGHVLCCYVAPSVSSLVTVHMWVYCNAPGCTVVGTTVKQEYCNIGCTTYCTIVGTTAKQEYYSNIGCTTYGTIIQSVL